MNIKTDFLKGIGEKITQIREKKDMSQADLVLITGIEKSEISRYEQGKINLTVNTLLKLAVALNVHPMELFDFKFDIKKYNIDD